jgi:Protein of unknown function, DUF547
LSPPVYYRWVEGIDVMKCGWLAGVIAVVTLCGVAGGACAPAATAPQYNDYHAALMAFVDANGRVDYAGLKAQRVYLDDFVTYLERLDPKTYDAWSERDRMALWINAYNALTLRAIIDNYPIAPPSPNRSYPANSIRQIRGVWDFNRVNVMGQSITLGYIETKILRRDFHDARVHMALSSAAVSSPMLRAEPYEGSKLEAQLDDQVRKFLSDPRQLRIDRAGKEARVSEMFRLYAEDFAPKETPRTPPGTLERAGVRAFASRYVSANDHTFLTGNDYRVTYAPFDWTLNEQPR